MESDANTKRNSSIGNTERIIIDMANDMKNVKNDVSEIKQSLRIDYVTKQFLENEILKIQQAIKETAEASKLPNKLVYGVVALILVAFFGGVIALVIR